MGSVDCQFAMKAAALPCLLDGKKAARHTASTNLVGWFFFFFWDIDSTGFASLTYTWLVDGRAAKISAPKFINRVEKWIVSKIHDPVMFPTTEVSNAPETSATMDTSASAAQAPAPTEASADDWIGKSSGFHPTFYKDCQGIMKQMFRCYAHLYHAHWLNPFWHINKHDILNMCFVHFVTVAKYYKLVSDKEMEPMQPLIDLFIKQQRIPPEALSGGHWAQQISSGV